MFGIGPATRIYPAAGSTDMRKSFEGLFGLVRDRLSCDPLSGHIFLFSNAQRNPAETSVPGWERPLGVREAS
jgi:transposase